jgi:exopolyphosphatase / guanosine-5'-triphosphate,3'-diphosphate pyrophosphatase
MAPWQWMTRSPTPPPSARNDLLAAIDVGTNSFHMIVARLVGDDGFEVLAREKEIVRLGHGGGEMKMLDADAIERGVGALRRMRQIADSAGAPIRAVATSAVREASNSAVFLDAAREAGVEVEVISGVEEARLIHLGVLQAVPVFDRRLLLIDIGGGSTEVLVGESGDTLFARSFKLGAVRLTDRFFSEHMGSESKGAVPNSAVQKCRAHIRSTIANVEREILELGHAVAIASSGTAEAVARMVHATTNRAELRTFNCYEFGTDELDAIVAQLVAAPSVAARRQLPGLDAARADIILAGALVLQTIAEEFEIARFTFSDYALREGVLLDTIQRQRGLHVHSLRDVARRSVRQLAQRCDDDPLHSEHVARLAVQLFDATTEAHGLGDEYRHLLEAASLLANVGLVVSHSKHHLHSYYVIRHSELVGFTDPEIELISLVARYHRKSSPKSSHPEYMLLDDDGRHAVRVLAGLLRIAIGLDRSHDQRVRSTHATVERRRVVVHALADAGTALDLELYAAGERKQLLADALGREVDVIAGQ